MNVAADIDRAHDEVVVGSRWFGWGHHWQIKRQRTVDGVREVLTRRLTGERKNVNCWVAAWRVQKYCTRSEAE